MVATSIPGYCSTTFRTWDLPAAFISGKGGVPSVPYNPAEEMAFYPTARDIEAVPSMLQSEKEGPNRKEA